jgi:hypothetical protein
MLFSRGKTAMDAVTVWVLGVSEELSSVALR